MLRLLRRIAGLVDPPPPAAPEPAPPPDTPVSMTLPDYTGPCPVCRMVVAEGVWHYCLPGVRVMPLEEDGNAD